MLLLLTLQLNLFQSPVTQTYDKRDATFEILLMLIGAFILGFLFRHFLGYMSKKEIIVERNFDSNSRSESGLIQPAAKSSVAGESKKIETTKVKLKSEKLASKVKTKGSEKDKKIKTTKKTEKKATKTKAEPKLKTEPKAKMSAKVIDESKASKAKKAAPKVKSGKKTISKKKDDLNVIE